jgi:hypothetical protein
MMVARRKDVVLVQVLQFLQTPNDPTHQTMLSTQLMCSVLWLLTQTHYPAHSVDLLLAQIIHGAEECAAAGRFDILKQIVSVDGFWYACRQLYSKKVEPTDLIHVG